MTEPGRARWPHLFSPLNLGPLTLPNRIVMPGMDPSLGAPDGAVTDVMIRHYRDRAAGGAGLIVTGNMACQPVGRVSPWMPLVSDDRFVPGLTRLASAVREAGGRLFVQVSHAGRQTQSEMAGARPVSASEIPCPVMREPPRALADEEVSEVADAFAEGARRVQEAGADGVEFHMAHGYLVCQFLSPYSNLRTDRWGGDETGRARLAVEIVRRTRALCGPDFPVQCRLSADERVPGGIDPPLAVAYARRLVAAGVTSLSISACNYESYRYNMPAYYLPEATYADLARAVRIGVDRAVPVVAVGRFRRPEVAERVLAEGDADLVAFGRALIADPNLPRLLAAGDPGAVRPCVACNRCSEAITRGPLRCLVNPEAGRDAAPATPADVPLTIAVIGGGPAGVTAAVEAARRGHRVRIVEATDRLGGKANASAAPPAKEAFAEYADWLERQAAEAGVEVEFGRRIDPEALAGLRADRVVLAVGAEGNPAPPIPGLAAHPAVRRPEDVLHDGTPRAHALVLGGGAEGCEVADLLAHRPGIGHVTLVELRPKVGLGLPTSVRFLLEERLAAAGVEVRTRRTVAGLSAERVELADHRGRTAETLPPADLVVLAIGVRAPAAWEAVADPRLRRVGDAHRPATILEAVAEAWHVGRGL